MFSKIQINNLGKILFFISCFNIISSGKAKKKKKTEEPDIALKIELTGGSINKNFLKNYERNIIHEKENGKDIKNDNIYTIKIDKKSLNGNIFNNMSKEQTNIKSITGIARILKYLNNNDKIKNIDMSYMFSECSYLISITDISEWNTKKVTNMSGMFSGCSSLISLPDIYKWNTKKVTNMSGMFSGCKSLISLQDIYLLDTTNVTNMSEMFLGCSSLTSLPDISEWNTKKVTNMSGMFLGCSSLISLPDISRVFWM